MHFDSKIGNREVFLMKPSINIINPNEKNVLMMPNHEKKGDCYVNPCLSQVKGRASILKLVIRVAFLMKSKHQYH